MPDINLNSRITVVICTLSRPKEIVTCLNSILSSDGANVLVVDQEEGSVRYPESAKLKIVYSKRKGLSLARNIGWQQSASDIVAYIDDDAITLPGYLSSLKSALADPAILGVAGKIVLEDGLTTYAKSQRGKRRLLREKEWRALLGGNMAFRRRVLEELGGFDERFGAGREWASGEESDFFFRLYRRKGECLLFAPEVLIAHPLETTGKEPAFLKRKYYYYAKGHGALFAKHWQDYRSKKMLFRLVGALSRPLLRIIQFLLTGRMRRAVLYKSIFKGTKDGFLGYSKRKGTELCV